MEEHVKQGIKLYLGDCFEVFREIPDKSVEMVLTDPPYGTTACEWDKCPPWDKLFSELWRMLKKNGVICMFSQNPLAAEIIVREKKYFRHEWVWEKSLACGYLSSKKCPMRAHELILIFAKGKNTYNAIPIPAQYSKPYTKTDNKNSNVYKMKGKLIKTKSADGSRYPRDVIFAKSVSTTFRKHPTQKPLLLLEMLIGQYTHPGETVLDPFAGSGSTLRAAQLTNRKAIGMELNPQYYSKAVSWLESGEAIKSPLKNTNQPELNLAL